jgi:hypothetical protein
MTHLERESRQDINTPGINANSERAVRIYTRAITSVQRAISPVRVTASNPNLQSLLACNLILSSSPYCLSLLFFLLPTSVLLWSISTMCPVAARGSTLTYYPFRLASSARHSLSNSTASDSKKSVAGVFLARACTILRTWSATPPVASRIPMIFPSS